MFLKKFFQQADTYHYSIDIGADMIFYYTQGVHQVGLHRVAGNIQGIGDLFMLHTAVATEVID